MNVFERWLSGKRAPKPEEPIPFDVMKIPLPGEYAACIESAETYRSKEFGNYIGVKVKLRLVPNNPKDEQQVYHILSRRQYVELLAQLNIPRTNDVGVLVGQIILVKVSDRNMGDDWGTYTRVEVLKDPKNPTKRRSTRARSPRKKS